MDDPGLVLRSRTQQVRVQEEQRFLICSPFILIILCLYSTALTRRTIIIVYHDLEEGMHFWKLFPRIAAGSCFMRTISSRTPFSLRHPHFRFVHRDASPISTFPPRSRGSPSYPPYSTPTRTSLQSESRDDGSQFDHCSPCTTVLAAP